MMIESIVYFVVGNKRKLIDKVNNFIKYLLSIFKRILITFPDQQRWKFR